MNTRTLAWGVMGGVSLLASLACSGKINEVGNVDTGGSAGNEPGSSGSGGGGFDTGGASGQPPMPFAGTQAVGGGGATGIGGNHPTCFTEYNANNTGDDDRTHRLGPQNAVFVETRIVGGSDVKNYADQQVFGDIGVWEAYANFPTSELAADTTLSLPADLSSAPANFGQLYLTRQSCVGLPAAGHKLTVEVWWKLGGAIIGFPTEGLALGTVSKNKPVWFEDTVRAFVVGEPEANRVMNTLNRVVIEHTFADDDETDAGKVTLGLWLLPDFDFPSKFYIGNVKWD